MSKRDEQLQRLFEAASRAPRDVPPEMPFGFETRVLAHWAAGSASGREASMLPFFQRAFVACVLVMLMCLAFSYQSWNTPVGNPEYAMSDVSSIDDADISMP